MELEYVSDRFEHSDLMAKKCDDVHTDLFRLSQIMKIRFDFVN